MNASSRAGTPREMSLSRMSFFFNDTPTPEIYTLSLHDALPISRPLPARGRLHHGPDPRHRSRRSEEHTSELQSPDHLVCRLLLEKKNSLVSNRGKSSDKLRMRWRNLN